MNSVTQALFDTLNGDGTLTALLGTHDLGAGAAASIFNGTIIYEQPEPTIYPYIVFNLISSNYDGVKNADARELSYELLIAGGEALIYDMETLGTIAERIRVLLHKQALSISGWTMVISIVDGPIYSTFDDQSVALSMNYTCKVYKDV